MQCLYFSTRPQHKVFWDVTLCTQINTYISEVPASSILKYQTALNKDVVCSAPEPWYLPPTSQAVTFQDGRTTFTVVSAVSLNPRYLCCPYGAYTSDGTHIFPSSCGLYLKFNYHVIFENIWEGIWSLYVTDGCFTRNPPLQNHRIRERVG